MFHNMEDLVRVFMFSTSVSTLSFMFDGRQ